MANGDVYKTTLEWVYRDIDVAVQNVIYFRQVGDFADPTHLAETDLGQRIKGVWLLPNGAGDFRNGYVSTNFAFLNVRVQRIYPFVLGAYLTPVNVAGGGADVVYHVPSVCAMVVRLRTVLNSARGRGRVYMGGFSSVIGTIPPTGAFKSHGYWADAYTSMVATWWNAIIATCATPGTNGVVFNLGVWSRSDAGPHPPYNFAYSPVSSIEVTDAIRVVRRREVGVGI